MGSLVNLGAAGAVIIVVIIFVKAMKERDAEWRSFFTELNRVTCADAERRMELTEKILEMVQAVLRQLESHDAKVDARIEAASRATISGLSAAIDIKTRPNQRNNRGNGDNH